jgi:hypothetical protein
MLVLIVLFCSGLSAGVEKEEWTTLESITAQVSVDFQGEYISRQCA